MNVFRQMIVVITTILLAFNVSGSMEWKRDYIERFKYTLVDDKKHLVFYFGGDNNNVAVTYAIKKGVYVCPLYEWRIDRNGELVFYEPKKGIKTEVMRFELIELSGEKVSVLNEGEVCVFQRLKRH